MLVVRTEGKIFRIDSGADNALYDILQVVGCAALADMDMNATAHLFQRVFKAGRFMVGIHPRHLVSAQLPVRQIRGMSVNRPVFKQQQFGKHALVAVDNPRIIHHFPQSQNPRIADVRIHIVCGKNTAVIVHMRRRYTGRHHDINVRRRFFRLIKNIVNPGCTADIRRLMGIYDKRRRPETRRRADQLVWRNHGGFQMQMCVDKARCKIFSTEVDLLFSAVTSRHPRDQTVLDCNV